jgi:hypothetical protein
VTAGYAWLLILGFIVIFEAHAVLTHRQTLSAWMWMMEHNSAWFKYGVSALVLALIVHLFFVKWP